MSTIDHIRRYHGELTEIRHDLHRHPELGLEEHRTAEIVARLLESWGIEVHRGVGKYGIRTGPTAAGGAFFDIEIGGKGSHGARPENSIDPVLAACHIATALQAIVSRNISPREQAVVSVTKVAGGDAYNVIPQTA